MINGDGLGDFIVWIFRGFILSLLFVPFGIWKILELIGLIG